MSTPSELRLYPDPVLARAADPADLSDPALPDILQRMDTCMREHEGVGLAAPQIGVSLRIFLMRPGRTATACMNPEILSFGPKTETMDEGCLSIPGVFLPVRRAREIEVRYRTSQGSVFRSRLEGMAARVFQHELDHLNGILIIDRAGSWQRWKVRDKLTDLRKSP